jgi:hypothetical protein
MTKRVTRSRLQIKTDNTMTKRVTRSRLQIKTDNTMTKRVTRSRLQIKTDNTMTKRKRTKGQHQCTAKQNTKNKDRATRTPLKTRVNV